MALLRRYLEPHWPRVLLLALLLSGTIGLQIANPQIMRRFIDTAAAGSNLRGLTPIAVLFLAVALGTHLLTVATVFVSEDLAWRTTNALRTDLALHCMQLDMAFHNAHTPGELVERIDGDVGGLSRFFSRFVVVIGINLLMFVGVLLVLFLTDWRIGLFNVALATAVTAAVFGFRKAVGSRWNRSRQATAEQTSFLEESLLSTEDIRSRGAVAYMIQRLHRVSRERFYRHTQAHVFSTFALVVAWSVADVGTYLGLGLGVRLFQLNAVTLGTVYIILHYTIEVTNAVRQIADEVQGFQEAGASIGRIQELLRAQSSIQEGHGAPLAPGALPVEFRSVSFSYGDKDNVLHDVSFRLQAGEVLGLLGRTGSGKTTLTRLLFRLYDPTAGTIYLDGVDIREARLAELRGRVGMVTQEVQLFQATLRDNLALFNREIPDAQILQALRDLGLWRWYQSLPDGLETGLGSGGAGLSAGEAQLLAFARVLLTDPGLVILDEATSRLDPVTEQQLERAVERLLYAQRRTAIIIAHRLATVQRTDKVIILEGGHICEAGRRVELARDPDSRYAHLLRVGMEEMLA